MRYYILALDAHLDVQGYTFRKFFEAENDWEAAVYTARELEVLGKEQQVERTQSISDIQKLFIHEDRTTLLSLVNLDKGEEVLTMIEEEEEDE
jgi:hypothetical protein